MIEPRAESFLEDFFTSEEVHAAHRKNGAQKDLWVTIAWGAKESVLKALRKGLRLDTRSMEIGKVDGIEDWGNQMGEWRSVELKQVSGEILGWQAWWRNHQGLVQTLAFLDQQKGSPQVTLHELPAAKFCLPDPKEWIE